MKKIIDLTGRRFGRLRVINLSHVDKYKIRHWFCLCDCGNETIAAISHLNSGETQSCGCLKQERIHHPLGAKNIRWKGHGEISATVFCKIQYRAKIKQIEFNVTIEEIWDLFLKQNRKCALTGRVLTFNKRKDSTEGTASLDRIDSSKGYSFENIQWIHKDLQYMKVDFSQEEFINYCYEVADYKRNQNGK